MTRNIQIPEPPTELLNYCRELEELITEKLQVLRDQPFPESADSKEAVEAIRMLGKSGSLEEMGLVPCHGEELAANFREIASLFQRHFPKDPLAIALQQAPVAEWFAAGYHPSSSAKVLPAAALAWAERQELDSDNLQELLHWAAAPARRWAAEHYREDLATMVTNERGRCPICGRNGDFAELSDREHGRRYLACMHCDISWPFRRIGCIYCGNKEFETLGYLLVDGCKTYKIYHCEKCLGYLKTYDRRDDGPLTRKRPLLENIHTYFLDLLALKQGYLPSPAAKD